MELKLRKHEDIYIVDILGDLDLYSSLQLKDLFIKLLEKKPRVFIMNLESVSFLDSSGIGALITMYNTALQKHIKFLLANVRGQTRNVMSLTRLEKFFPIASSIEDAIAQVLHEE